MTRPADKAPLGIGALAQATGIDVETLRTWERRYGAPRSARTLGGHRRYEAAEVGRLRLVRAAMEQGYRPGQVVAATADELGRLLALTETKVDLDPLFAAMGSLDAGGFEHELEQALAELGAEGFVLEVALPFLAEVGLRWRDSRVRIFEEHFASAMLGGFLRARWRALSDRARGATVVLATLPGEAHDLPLHLAALLCATAGRRVVFLGANSPVQDLSEAVAATGAHEVILAVSAAADPLRTRRDLAELLRGCAARVAVGAPSAAFAPGGVAVLTSFEQLLPWLAHRS
jgi:DNA-binding transcriptional MerR regulator